MTGLRKILVCPKAPSFSDQPSERRLANNLVVHLSLPVFFSDMEDMSIKMDAEKGLFW